MVASRLVRTTLDEILAQDQLFLGFNRIMPAFDSALQGVDPAFQRRTRLQAEDLLQRIILVEEKSEFLQKVLQSGDISALFL